MRAIRRPSLVIAIVAAGVAGVVALYYLRPVLDDALDKRSARRRRPGFRVSQVTSDASGPPAVVTADDPDMLANVDARVSATRVAGVEVRPHPGASEGNGTFQRASLAPPRRRRISGMKLVGVAAVAGVLALGLGSWAFVEAIRDSNSTEPTAQSALTERTVALLASPGAQRIPVAGSNGAVLVVGANGEAVLILTGLPEAPAGKAYEAWVIPPGKKPTPQAAGVFSVRDKVIELGRRVPPGATVAITLERPEGVSAPTQAPKLFAQRR